MRSLSTSSPQEEVLAHLEGITKKIRAAMGAALPETRKVHHACGFPLGPEKSYDRQYFAYTLRMITKRNLAEQGVEAEVEDGVPDFKLDPVLLGGLLLRMPGFVIRILRSDSNLELPRAASQSRAQFYEQRQTSFPFVDERPARDGLNVVYLWEVNRDLSRLSWQIALPKNRYGECFWTVRLEDEEDGRVRADDGNTAPPSRPPIAAVAIRADSDLTYTPKTNMDEGKKDARKSKSASNGA